MSFEDFKRAINECEDPYELRDILETLDTEIDSALQSPYESVSELRTTRELELLLRYGEQKLERLLA